MRLILWAIVLVLLFTFYGQSSSDQLGQARSLFLRGNSYYNQENFEQAINSYENILNIGIESGPLYYNLGNAYFKDGSLGKAILNYLRAQKLIPQDSDLRLNLTYAQSLIKGASVVAEKKWLQRIFSISLNLFKLDTIVLFCCALYFILSLLIIFAVIKPYKILFFINLIIAFLLTISILTFLGQFSKTIIQKEGVVIVETAEVKFEPFSKATTFFILNEGESVCVVNSEKDWMKIKRLDGKQGWVKKTDIEVL